MSRSPLRLPHGLPTRHFLPLDQAARADVNLLRLEILHDRIFMAARAGHIRRPPFTSNKSPNKLAMPQIKSGPVSFRGAATNAAPKISTMPTICLGVGPISFLFSILIANKERRIDLPEKMRGLPSDIKRPATIIPNVVMRAEQQIPRVFPHSLPPVSFCA